MTDPIRKALQELLDALLEPTGWVPARLNIAIAKARSTLAAPVASHQLTPEKFRELADALEYLPWSQNWSIIEAVEYLRAQADELDPPGTGEMP